MRRVACCSPTPRASASRSRSASRPLPSPLDFTTGLLSCDCSQAATAQDFAHQLDVRLGAFALTVEIDRRRTEARRFGKAHIARYHRRVNLVTEVLLQLGGH